MADVIAAITVRVAEFHERGTAICAEIAELKERSLSFALDVMAFGKEVEAVMPESDLRDELIAATRTLSASLVHIAAVKVGDN